MPRLAWVTDPHFNFVTATQFDKFMDGVAAHRPDALLLGGDIAQARDVVQYLRLMAAAMDCPIYFVLGNHDYYGGSVEGVRRVIQAICRELPRLIWLNDSDVIPLSDTTALVGHGGWADGRLGDYAGSKIRLNDYRLIEDLAGLDKPQRLLVLNRLGDEAAAHLRTVLPTALDRHRQTILLTHVPPFRQACWHQDHVSGDDWLPHMTCKAVGDVIEPIMCERPDRHLTVLCGHTHSGGEVSIRENLHVITGGAEYGFPAITRVWDVD